MFGPGAQAFHGQSQFGPYSGGYRSPGPQQQSGPVDYGQIMGDLSNKYGGSYGTPMQSQVDANNAQFRGAQDAFRAMSGAYASPNNRQSDRGPSIFAGNNIYKR